MIQNSQKTRNRKTSKFDEEYLKNFKAQDLVQLTV